MKRNLAIFDLDNTILNGDSDYSWINFLIQAGHVDKEEYEKLLKDANPILRGLLRLLSGRLRDIEKPSNASKVKK